MIAHAQKNLPPPCLEEFIMVQKIAPFANMLLLLLLLLLFLIIPLKASGSRSRALHIIHRAQLISLQMEWRGGIGVTAA